jgi:hypothetical protein
MKSNFVIYVQAGKSNYQNQRQTKKKIISQRRLNRNEPMITPIIAIRSEHKTRAATRPLPSPSEMAFWISAHLTTTLCSLRPSSSSMRYSLAPAPLLFPAAEPPSARRWSGDIFTLETSTHCTTANAMPTTAAAGTTTCVASSGRNADAAIASTACEIPKRLGLCATLFLSKNSVRNGGYGRTGGESNTEAPVADLL